jgi:hypothetical protein
MNSMAAKIVGKVNACCSYPRERRNSRCRCFARRTYQQGRQRSHKKTIVSDHLHLETRAHMYIKGMVRDYSLALFFTPMTVGHLAIKIFSLFAQ